MLFIYVLPVTITRCSTQLFNMIALSIEKHVKDVFKYRKCCSEIHHQFNFIFYNKTWFCNII